MGQMDSAVNPCSAQEFQEALLKYRGETTREKIQAAVDSVWPAVTDGDNVRARANAPDSEIAPVLGDREMYTWWPSYREHQRTTVVDIIENLYVDDNDVCLLSCPTGGGKSLLIYTATAVVDAVVNRKSFSTTPLNTLIDQIDDDELLDDVITIKGRNNYQCVHPQDAGTPVDQAICQRDDDFDCQFKDQPHTSGGCPYYGRKAVAQNRSKVVTNLSFLMANSMIPDVVDAGFEPRELLTIDECQGVDDFALLFVGFTVSENRIPVDFDDLQFPSERDSQSEVIDWLSGPLMRKVTEKIEELEAQKESITFSEKQHEQLEDLQRFHHKATNFISDVRDHEWAMTFDSYGGTQTIEFEPITVGRFLDGYLWDQGHKMLCASATIPPNFVEEVGLDDEDVARINVESTFPPERRPVITTESVGKMTMSERDKTIPKMADQIGRIADVWDGHKGIVHCNSYKIAERLYDRLPNDVQQRTRLQDGDDRTGSLQSWVDAPVNQTGRYTDTGGQLFLSIAQEEGISLDDDDARFNIVAKASYPFLGDERVSYRINELNDWDWYNSQAAIDLQQAAGRTMRSKDDWCATYILDDSAVNLIERNEHLFERWFLDSVDCDYDESVVNPDNGRQSRENEVERKTDTGQEDLDDIADEYFG